MRWVYSSCRKLQRESGEWMTPVVVYAQGKRTVVWYKPDPYEVDNRVARLKEERPELWPEDVQRAIESRGEFTKLFPRLRQVLPGTIQSAIASVQPMTVPTGLAFFKEVTYGAEEDP